jgi:hypothetical protein
MIERFPVDWAAYGYIDNDLDQLVEQMLRMTQSFVEHPGTPPRTGAALRGYLARWLAPAVAAVTRPL